MFFLYPIEVAWPYNMNEWLTEEWYNFDYPSYKGINVYCLMILDILDMINSYGLSKSDKCKQ